MDQTAFNGLSSRILTDGSFREEFFNDPAGTAERMGYKLTDDQISRIKSMDRREFDEMVDKAQKDESFSAAWAA